MIQKLILTVAVTLVAALVAAPVALAQGGRPDSAGSSNAAQTQNEGTASQGASFREQAEARAKEAREAAEQKVEAIKQEVEERKATIKKEVCERRQAQLKTVLPRLATGATSVKSSFDTVYSRVQGFYESGQLTVANYETLNANVAAAQAAAGTAIAAIESASFELDCENPDLGSQLDGYRAAVRNAQESLGAYRDALVQLISAMRAAQATEGEGNGEQE